MTEIKDMTALSLTYMLGIIIGLAVYSGLHYLGQAYIYASIIIAVEFLTLAGIVLTKQKTFAHFIVLFAVTGIFCASVHSVSSAGIFPDSLKGNAPVTWLRNTIADIPFKSERTAPLVCALVTGDKSGLDNATLAAFRDSGASHILALSGLHLGIIYSLLLWVTSFIGKSRTARRIRSIVIISLSGIYTIITGACPSLVRAFLFILLNECGKLLHRQHEPLRVFFAALMIQLTINPSVIESVGFQLSYLAMAGIFILFPRLQAWYPKPENADSASGRLLAKINLPRKIWDAAALTISCQIFTGPLAWLRFGTFPRYFLLTNILALPVTNILMTFAVATTIFSAAGICPEILIKATDLSASALLYIMDVISGM